MRENASEFTSNTTVTIDGKRGKDPILQIHIPQHHAYRTPEAAVAAAKAVLARDTETHLTIAVKEGAYSVSSPIVFQKSDFGHPASTLSIVGTGRKTPVLSSLRHISGSSFVKYDNHPYYVYKMSDAEKLPNGLYPNFRDFYRNGKRVPLAECPLKGYIAFPIPNEKKRASEENLIYKIYVEADAVEGLATDVLPLPELWIRVEWQIHCLHIVSIDENDREGGFVAARIKEEEWKVFVRSYCQSLAKRPYVLRNSLTFLQTPDSFFYDRSNGMIFYYPASESDDAESIMAESEFSYPLSENLLILDGVSNVTLRNLAFTGTGSNFVTDNGYITGQCGWIKSRPNACTTDGDFISHAAVLATDTEGCTVTDCTFFELGIDALHFRSRTENLTVRNCVFRNIGATAIRIGKPVMKWDDKTNAALHIVLENNFIDGTGIAYNSNPGIFVNVADTLTISHNTILNSCYSAISVGWSWAVSTARYGESKNLMNTVIAYNYIDNFMYGMRDGGAIYTLGGNADKSYTGYMNEVHHNYMSVGETVGEGMGGYHFIYHDQGSSHWYDHDNVMLGRDDAPASAAFVIAGEYNCKVQNAYLLNYTLPDPPVTLERTDYDTESIIVENVFRNIPVDAIPEEAASVIRAAGCTACIACPPAKQTYSRSVTVYVDAKEGKDASTGLNPEKPVATLEKAVKTALNILSLQKNADVTILLLPGTHTVRKTVSVDARKASFENSRLTLTAKDKEKTVIENSARTAFSFKDTANIVLDGITVHSRNASLGSAVFSFRNIRNLQVLGCDFTRINADCLCFTGVCENIGIVGSAFTHIGGKALSFGMDAPLSLQNAVRRVTVSECLFDSIGYIFEHSPAVLFRAVSGLTVRNNTFLNLSYEALRLGHGEAISREAFGYCKNLDRVSLTSNYIADFALKGDYAAIYVTGGNCTRFHYQPFNIISKNVIVPGAAGGEDAAYSVFHHAGSSSQWHTRQNILLLNDHRPSKSPLCRFGHGYGAAYASWADDNALIGSAEKHIFCVPEEISEGYDLHDKDTHFVTPDGLTEKEMKTYSSAGSHTHHPHPFSK